MVSSASAMRRTGCAAGWCSPRDHFEAGLPIALDDGSELRAAVRVLVDRLFDSFELPTGPTTYLRLIDPLLSDGETVWSRRDRPTAAGGGSYQEWPDAAPGKSTQAIRARSASCVSARRMPFDLKHNHQVLAYGYRRIRR